MTPLISLAAITKSYQIGSSAIHALLDVSIAINRNEYTAVVGSSGSGKSTMMNILGCLDKPTSGQYFLDGADVSSLLDRELALTRNRKIGFVFQNFNLLPKMSAIRNVMQPLIYRAMPGAERQTRAQTALERVGLLNRKDHLPGELSGGQRQRVAIARALVTSPSLLLADEPTGNLDSGTAVDILGLFDELHAEGQTLVLVTHDEKIAKHCHRRIVLHDGQVQSDEAG